MSTVAAPTGTDESAARFRNAPPTMLSRARWLPRLRAAVSLAFVCASLAAAWWFLAPPQLGGSTSFVTVDGTSMLPKLRTSDLVALRPQGTYRVGDVVGYRSRLIHRVVLHRIVAVSGGHYVFKGDNNAFIDPDRPTRAQFVGKLWLEAPSAGRLVQQLHRPPIAAALAAMLVLVAGLGGSRRQRTA